MSWKDRPEGGGPFALWLIREIGLRGGRGVARLLLFPITLYFLLVRGPERRASRAYLSRVLGRAATLRDIARHMHTFAATILDRVFMLAGRMDRFDVRAHGLDALHAQLDRGRGALVFGSHLGSFDALRVLARQRPDIRVRVVLDTRHNPALTRLLDALDPELAKGVICAGQDGPSIVLAIQQALSEGALVALLVDRARPGEPALPAPFLGQPAPFPTAPWLIAATLHAPVTLAFGVYRGGNRYDLAFEHFSDGLSMPRATRARQLADCIEAYARRLQAQAIEAPYNWFNFYDFWAFHHVQAPRVAPPAANDAAAGAGAGVERDGPAAVARRAS